MPRTSKKETKPLKAEAPKEPKAKKAEVVDKCGACAGTGLERPTFSQSPLCSVCLGTGVIN